MRLDAPRPRSPDRNALHATISLRGVIRRAAPATGYGAARPWGSGKCALAQTAKVAQGVAPYQTMPDDNVQCTSCDACIARPFCNEVSATLGPCCWCTHLDFRRPRPRITEARAGRQSGRQSGRGSIRADTPSRTMAEMNPHGDRSAAFGSNWRPEVLRCSVNIPYENPCASPNGMVRQRTYRRAHP